MIAQNGIPGIQPHITYRSPDRHVSAEFFGSMKKSQVRTQNLTVWLLVLVPVAGILKGLTGSRYFPLFFDIPLMVIFISSLMGNIRRKNVDLLDLFLLIFLSLAFLEMFNPNVPSVQAGIEGFRKFAFISIAFYLGRWLLDLDAFRKFQSLLCVFGFFIACYGIKQFFHMGEIDYRIIDLASSSTLTYMMGGYVRPFSILPGCFHLGAYMGVTVLSILAYQVYSRVSLRQKILLSIAMLVELLALFFTRTKSNWLGLLGGILVVFIFAKIKRYKVINSGLIFVATMGAFVWVYPLITPYYSIPALEQAVLSARDPMEAVTFRYRMDLWREYVPAILDKPISGYGTSSAGEGLSFYYWGKSFLYFGSHSLFFKIMLELGLIGLFNFIGIIAYSIINGLKEIKNERLYGASEKIGILVWCFSVVVLFLLAGIASPILDAYPVNYYFWLLLGFLAKGKKQRT